MGLGVVPALKKSFVDSQGFEGDKREYAHPIWPAGLEGKQQATFPRPEEHKLSVWDE
jgi:hypothetical protein